MFIKLIVLLLLQLSQYVQCADRPNILLFLTDDQDVFLDGMTPLVKTKKLLMEEGTTYHNAFVTTPVCCPSRASMLTGRYLHNTHTSNNSIAGNCGGQFWRENMEPKSFGNVLKSAGYTTMYAGKYMNQYGTPDAGGITQIPPGWDSWNGLVGNSKYYNYKLSVNGKEERHGSDYESDYLTDVIGRKAHDFLESWNKEEPFLMVLGTPASHQPVIPAPQYSKNFSDMVAPRIPSYNIPAPDKHWLLRINPQNLSTNTKNNIDDAFRNRWRTLLSVDDLVSNTLDVLKKKGELDNTYIFYTSDHGYHLGEFALTIDKRQPYEFDIRVPMVVRGPSIKKNETSDSVALLIDLAPTFLDIAGVPADPNMDGQSLLDRSEDKSRQFLVEYRGESGQGIDQGCEKWSIGGDMCSCRADYECKCFDARNNTYDCIRTLSADRNMVLCAFDDDENFVELYDLTSDPYQLENLAHSTYQHQDHRPSTSMKQEEYLLDKVIQQEKEKLASLITCSGTSCHTIQ